MKAIIALLTLLSLAESNYQMAVYNAQFTDGSDNEIQMHMKSYGFEIDANDTTEVSMNTKILALKNTPKFTNH